MSDFGLGEIPPELRRAADPAADLAVRAPGRANLIGEHTDYNDGFVLPVALDLATYALGHRTEHRIRLSSLQEPGEVTVDARTGEGPDDGWGRYVSAVVRALLDESIEVSGFEGVIHSEVPVGSGLSSSAALEVTIALAVVERSLEPVRLAEICRRAENHYVGVSTGIMDQLASVAGRAGHAVLIDCRDNSVETVAIPDDIAIAVVDSSIRRGLSDSAYNERMQQCLAGARALGVPSLRDATIEDLARARDLDEVVFRRVRHVVTENQRVLDAVTALRDRDATRLGALFEASHRSLAEDYEVSLPELDALVAAAQETTGVIAARLTGAGFGGCTVNLVEADTARDSVNEIAERYAQATGRKAETWISLAAGGATRAIVDPTRGSGSQPAAR